MRPGDGEAAELSARYADRAEPAWSAVDPKLWALALDRLVHTQRLDAAGWAAAALVRTFPGAPVFASQELLLREAPLATDDAAYEAFVDDEASDVQVVRRRRAQAVLFVFTGVSGRAGMALPLAHRWFAAIDAHVVYLRDFNHQAFNGGVRSLGPDRRATLEGLWDIIDQLGASVALTCGNSLGGYAALHYGLARRARSILAFSAMTSMVPPLLSREEAGRLRLRSAVDLRPFLATAARPLRVLMVYGAECGFDARHARHVEDLPSVQLEALPGCTRHESVLRAVQLGTYAALLSRLHVQ